MVARAYAMSIRNSKLRKFRDEGNLISVRRDQIDPRSIQGFVVDFSAELVLLRYVHDFRFDGLLIIRRRDITSAKVDATNRLQREMMELDGQINETVFTVDLPIESYSALLASLPEYEIVILEDEHEGEFLIGTMHDVSEDVISINYFNGAGDWDDAPTEIATANITSCQLGTSYINAYTRHFERTGTMFRS